MSRVLIIDDDEGMVENLKIMLEMDGHEVHAAHNGREGLEALSRDPEIIFCDYNMPVMNGGDFVAKIHSDDMYYGYREVPIVGIGDFPETRKANLRESFSKGFRISKLEACIEKYCSTEV